MEHLHFKPSLFWRFNYWRRGGSIGVLKRYSKQLKKENLNRINNPIATARTYNGPNNHWYKPIAIGVIVGTLMLIIRCVGYVFFPQWIH